MMRAHLQGVISGRLQGLKAERLGPLHQSAIVILICLSLWVLHGHPREPWHHFAILICWSNAWERQQPACPVVSPGSSQPRQVASAF